MTAFRIFIELTVALCAVIALVVSIRSCILAKESQRTANNALSQAKKLFLEENRPYIVIEPIFDKKNKSYIRIIKEKTIFKVAFQYKVSNVGSAIAKNVITPPQATYEVSDEELYLMKGEIKDPISLAPGQSILFAMWVGFKILEESETEKFIEKLEAGSESFTHSFPAMYQNDLDTSLRYKIIVEHRISKETVEMLKSEMIKVPM